MFNTDMNASAYDRLSLETSLRAALEQKQLQLYYQPQVDLADGHITGCEALIRWIHPDIGMVSPIDFIPLAEETGLIGPMSDWVMEEAIRQCRIWLDAGLQDFTMGINLSALQFRQRDLYEQVRLLLEKYQVPPSAIELELTESILIEGVERILGILRNLTALGVAISIDDFGTGYSSLSYLKRFPIKRLKIDQTFVRDVVTDINDATMVKTIVLMADSLKLGVIAEGVETKEQAAFLHEVGCTRAQGYLFGRPMPAEAFEAQFVKSKS
jgi:EAL domain-containing protein (putative c-di-GMP-specific phosphodiesterase class I)